MSDANSKFSLGTFAAAGAPGFPALVIDDKVLALNALKPLLQAQGLILINADSMLGLMEAWDHNIAVLTQAVACLGDGSAQAVALEAKMMPVADLQVLPPVDLPRQVFCAGANYFKHVVDYIVARGPGIRPGTDGMSTEELRAFAEDMMSKRRVSGEPYIFNKPVSAICGAFEPLTILDVAEQPDWELELAVVISKPALNVSAEDAMDYVAGYTIANDISNRGQIFRKDSDMKPMGSDWVSSKSSPGYLPLGPYLVPKAFVPDPMQLDIKLALNGDMKQDESSADMLIGIPRLIEYLTARVQLLPGDILCTGSPAGNGVHYKRFLEPGDVMDASITGLGAQRNLIK